MLTVTSRRLLSFFIALDGVGLVVVSGEGKKHFTASEWSLRSLYTRQHVARQHVACYLECWLLETGNKFVQNRTPAISAIVFLFVLCLNSSFLLFL